MTTAAPVEQSCIYQISGGAVDAHNKDYWIRIADMRHLVHVSLPRQIREERAAYERARDMVARGMKSHGPETWHSIAATHKAMHDSRVRRLSQLRGLLSAVDLGFYNS